MIRDKKEYNKEYYQTNKKRIRLMQKEHSDTYIGRATNLVGCYNAYDKKYSKGEGDLTAQWVVDNILSKPCSHCGETDWKKIGCNRLDNSKPHTMDNVEPCCRSCNLKLAGKEKQTTLAKKVYQYTKDGKLIKIWNSLIQINRELGYNMSNISRCCRLEKYRKTYKGYRWFFEPL